MKFWLPVCVFLLLTLQSQGQEARQFYYLVIGSANYEQNAAKFKEPDFVPYDELSAAANSARLMTAIFLKYMQARGITAISTRSSMITKQKVSILLHQLDEKIRADGAKNPFILFYYCGHGISENMGWNQFFIPGNYTRYPGDKSFDELGKSLIFLGDITDFFLKKKYSYMAMVDCCRERNKDSSLPEKRLSYFFSQQNVETFKIVVQGLKYLNEYHQASPVIFAISPGSVAPTVSIPSQSFVSGLSTDDEAGPLCRRTILIAQSFERSGQVSMTLSSFVAAITKASLDTNSPHSVSFFVDPNHKTGNIAALRKR